MSDEPGLVVVVMGVAGSGKSTVGRLLAARLGADFIEGDDLHPAENRAKMSRGEPLDDADRAPWLATLVAVAEERRAGGRDVVLSCSALRRRYRDRLRGIGRPLLFVHLHGSEAVIRARMSARTDHFMPTSLIASQIATLEPPVGEPDVSEVDIDGDPAAIVEAILPRLAGAGR